MANRLRDLTTDTAFTMLLHDLLLNVRTAMPGIIRAINLDGGALKSVDVQPAIQQVVAQPDGVSNISVDLPTIPNVPVVMPHAQTQGLSVTIPISVGDACLLVMCDRSIDKWQESGGVQEPVENTTPRAHELTDAVCIVGLSNDVSAISDFQQDAVEIRDASRDNYVRVTDSGVTIKSGGSTITATGSDITLEIGSSMIRLQSMQIDIDSPTVLVNGSPI